MRIMLTGSTGMVGRNITNRLSSTNLTILAPRHKELELCNYQQVEKYIENNQPDLIIHAAGYVGGIHANMAEPVRFLVDNLDMGRNLLMAARKCHIPKFINIASSCMYPRDIDGALQEDMLLTGTLEPTNEGYSLAKNMVTRLCQYINTEDPMFQYKTIIPCNLYGLYDKFDPRVSHVLPAIIYKLHMAKLNDVDTVDIWGDGTARREFLFAGDLANCIFRALENFDTMPSLMNVGPGKDITINEYYQTAADVIGYTGSFTHDLTKPVGMKRKLMAVDRANNWGWNATTSLRDGILETYNHHCAEFSEIS